MCSLTDGVPTYHPDIIYNYNAVRLGIDVSMELHTHTINTVSPNFRQFVLAKYPSLSGNQPFARFFHYLCFGNFFAKDTHHLVIPTKRMAEEFFQQPYTTAFNGQAFLEDFRQQVLPDLRWVHSPPAPIRGRAGPERSPTWASTRRCSRRSAKSGP